jgi:hypothetical protein
LTINLSTQSALRSAASSKVGVALNGLFFDATMVGGTALICGSDASASWEYSKGPQFDDYVTVRTDVILEYERAITGLRLQLLHYKRIIARLVGAGEARDEYAEVQPVMPIDPASVRMINSILQVRIPTAATFRDFEEGEL